MLLVVLTLEAIAALPVAVRLVGGRERGIEGVIVAPVLASQTLTHAKLDAVAEIARSPRADRSSGGGMSRRTECRVFSVVRDLAAISPALR